LVKGAFFLALLFTASLGFAIHLEAPTLNTYWVHWLVLTIIALLFLGKLLFWKKPFKRYSENSQGENISPTEDAPLKKIASPLEDTLEPSPPLDQLLDQLDPPNESPGEDSEFAPHNPDTPARDPKTIQFSETQKDTEPAHEDRFQKIFLSSKFPKIMMAVVLALAYLLVFVTKWDLFNSKTFLKMLLHSGQWIVFGVGIVYGCFAVREKVSPYSIVALLLFTCLTLILLISGKEYYSAKLLILAILSMILWFKGNFALKGTILGIFSVYLGIGVLVLKKALVGIYPLYHWLLTGESELAASYIVILQQLIFSFVGPFGMGAEFMSEVDLFRPGDLGLNGLPYLSILAGNVTVALYIAIMVITIFALILKITVSLQGPIQGIASFVWFLVFFNFYLGLFALANPTILMVTSVTHGLPFIGSLQSGLQLIILAILAYYPWNFYQSE
jgi:hypothetical protein